MKHFLFTLLVICIFVINVCYSAPADNKDTNKDSKSAFGPAFDEIVVESSLTVRRKNPNARQARNLTETQTVKAKREINLHTVGRPGGSAASAEAQSFDVAGPLGSFGASAAGAQSQTFGLNPGAAFSGTQQYRFNGQTVNIDFGSAGAAVTTTRRKS